MFTLILLVIAGLGMAYFATQNAATIPIMIAGYPTEMPLYMIVASSLLIGLLFSWVISIFSGISSAFTLHGKDSTIHHANKKIEQLELENRKLEIENTRLTGGASPRVVDHEDKSIMLRKPSLFSRLRSSFS